MVSLLLTYHHRATSRLLRLMGSDRPAKQDKYANISSVAAVAR